MEQIVIESSLLEEWLRTAFIDDNGQVFLPCGALDDEHMALLCLAHDCVPVVRHQRHIYAPRETVEDELNNVVLAVAAFMAAPDVPIYDLVADARIGNPVICGPYADAEVEELSTNLADGVYSLTQDVDRLIPVNPAYTGTPMQPLTDFTNANTFDNWYCVYPDGKVEGFLSIAPYTNIREL